MKLTKILGVVAVAALALMAFASSASATTLAVGGVVQTKDVTFDASIKSGTSALLTDTSGFFANTCTASTVKAIDSTKTTGTVVTGPIEELTFGTVATPCTEGNPTVDAAGSLSVERIGTTTNGTVKSEGATVTVPSPFGTLHCTTAAEGTDIGTLTGVASGTATMDISAVLNCGITAKWSGTYVLTAGTTGLPTALSVEA